MTFEEFTEKCRDYIADIYDDVSLTIIKVMKNNGRNLTGLQFRRDKINISPTFYLEDYYREHEEGRNLYEICDDIMHSYEASESVAAPDMDFFYNYETAGRKIYCKVINYEKNKEFLQHVPHVECMDLAIVFYINVDIGSQRGTIVIRNEHFDNWGIELGRLYRDALDNTINDLKATVRSIEDVLIGIIASEEEYKAAELLDCLGDTVQGERQPMYVLSNKENFLGAACILDEDFLAEFADEIESDLLILPSSIHELILIPEREGIEVDKLQEMVVEINATQVSEDEVLSDSVYRFSRDIGKVIPA